MSRHNHLLRDDLRGPLLPRDGDSHISRINDWVGSDSWVEGCRKDKPMSDPVNYPEPKLPYRLTAKAYHDGAARNAGEIVYIRPSQRGLQHAKVEGVDYPDLPEPEHPSRQPTKFAADSETRLAAVEAMAIGLQHRLDDLSARMGNLVSESMALPAPDDAQAEADRHAKEENEAAAARMSAERDRLMAMREQDESSPANDH